MLVVMVLLLCVRVRWHSQRRLAKGSPHDSEAGQEVEKKWLGEELRQELSRYRLAANESDRKLTSKKLSIAITRPNKHSSGHRSFGCIRDTCRGLELEDLADRKFHRQFRSALRNDTSQLYRTNINYKVTILLLDTTQLNHMKQNAESLWKRIWETQASSTYVIAFDGGDAMGGNKGFQLRNKDKFARKFACNYDELKVQPTQYRLYIKRECEALMELSKRDQSTSFLLKPEAGSQGSGITFHTSANEVFEKKPEFYPCQDRKGIPSTSRFLVQEYIANPLLLSKCKFDARIYMFISSSSPFILWYHRGYLRRSLTPYSPKSRDRKAYLTNTHFQSSRENFNMSEHIWTFERMQQQLEKQSETLTGLDRKSVV